MTPSKAPKRVSAPESVDLPPGWVRARLADIANLVNGFAFTPRQWRESGVPIIRIQNLRNPDAAFNYFEGELPDRYRVRAGDLLFAWSGTPGTSFGAHVWRGGDAWLNQHIFRVEFDRALIDVEFLCAAMNYNLDHYIANAQGGSGLAHVRKAVVSSSWIRLPPLPEQRRIAAAMGAIDSDIREGHIALTRASHNLKRYLTAVLRAAIEGQLTADWRAQESRQSTDAPEREVAKRQDAPGRQSMEQLGLFGIADRGGARTAEPFAAREGLREIPAPWVWTTVGGAGECRVGRQRSPRPRARATLRPYLRVANVFEDRIDISDVLRMPFTHEEAAIYQLSYGDVLLNEGQSLELVGRAALYRDEIPGACFQNTLIRFRASRAVLPEFALLVFRHYLHSGRFQRSAKRTTNIAHLSVGRFSVIEFPLPPLAEQKEIVARASAQLGSIAASEHIINDGLARSLTLREAAIRQALEGKLTYQDPKDGSARELLANAMDWVTRRAAENKSMRRTKKKHVNNVRTRGRRSLLEILKSHPKGLTPEELLRTAGYDLSHVDDFYSALRDIQNYIDELRPPLRESRRWPKGATIVLRVKDGADAHR